MLCRFGERRRGAPVKLAADEIAAADSRGRFTDAGLGQQRLQRDLSSACSVISSRSSLGRYSSVVRNNRVSGPLQPALGQRSCEPASCLAQRGEASAV